MESSSSDDSASLVTCSSSTYQMTDNNGSVQVAVRIRPLVHSEIAKGCQEVLEVFPDIEQIRIKNSDKAFTFNYVFPSTATQEELYSRAVEHLLEKLFKGYNVTILAYGQTGSGKTYSMGTTYTGHGEMGVIPRAIHDIFSKVKDEFCYEFIITVSFMELYQEVLYDLLSDRPRDQCICDIREDASKGIVIQGLSEVCVNTASDVLAQLAKGSLGRATGATNMNAQSSRSHAIFTINITMQSRENMSERTTARFNLVDLAGSERSKKTGAIGTTFKEGVNINKGLLVLGNVISALGDEKQQHNFIPYRDSNLTRLLKDSLGGNSITLMLACVSPADYNVDETLSTLRYADRAKKIKNKPIVNQDVKTAEILELRKTIQQLKLQIMGQGGPLVSSEEIDHLQKEISELKLKIRDLTFQLSTVLNDNTGLLERVMILQTANENLNTKLQELKEQYDVTLNNINISIEVNDPEQMRENLAKLQQIQQQFVAIDSEQKKSDTELRNHESTITNRLQSPSPSDTVSNEVEITERQAHFTKKQMALKTELEEISLKLAMKEHLALQIQSNTQYMIDYTVLAESEEKINQLSKERDELLHQLKNLHAKDVSSKLAEQRRKRVQDLETQIQNLKKKVQEQDRLIKLKAKDEAKIRNLNSEIMQMKQDKVRLIKNMREESERFRLWRQQRERELCKLKNEDRKKQNMIVKMEAMHTKQQNVLKRKVEEAAAINKRLKDALALRKQAQDQRMGGKVEKIGTWLKQEIDVYINIVDADLTLADLLEDRATLQQQLDELIKDPTADPMQIKMLREAIETRSLQIQDLQQKILDFNEESKKKTRWDNIQTMTEAKAALKTMWDMVVDIKKSESATGHKMNEMQSSHSDLMCKFKALESEIKQLQQKHAKELVVLQKEHQEKVTILLNQLRGRGTESVDEQLKQRIQIQQERLDEQENLIRDLKDKNSELTNKLAVITETLAENSKGLKELQNTEKNIRELDVVRTVEVSEDGTQTPVLKRPASKQIRKHKRTDDGLFAVPEGKENELFNSSTDNEEIEVDDPSKDPDWRKTPLGKRLMEERRLLKQSNLFSTSTLGIKRSSDGGCTCTKKCTTRCGCRKSTRACTSACKCPSECTNKESGDTEHTNGDSTSEAGDSDSKRTRLEIEVPEKRSRKKTRQLFNVE